MSKDFGKTSLNAFDLKEIIFKLLIAAMSESFCLPPTLASKSAVVCRISSNDETSLISGSSDSSCTPKAAEGRESSWQILERNSVHLLAGMLSRRYSK